MKWNFFYHPKIYDSRLYPDSTAFDTSDLSWTRQLETKELILLRLELEAQVRRQNLYRIQTLELQTLDLM